MAQWLRTPAALLEDLCSIPSNHTKKLTTTCNSSSKRSDDFFWPVQASTHLAYNRDTHT